MSKETLQIEQNQQTVQRLSHRQVICVHVLEMSGPELEDEVKRQLDDNPALEIADPETTEEEAYDEPSSEVIEEADNDPDDDPADRYQASEGSAAEIPFYAFSDDASDIYTVLINQLREIDIDERERKIAQYIAGNIDENGWLTRTLSEMADDIAFTTGEDVSLEQMQDAFKIVRSLDPAGVGAVDLRDCLLLQIRRIAPKTLTSRIAETIVDEYFDLFSKRHFDRLQAYLEVGDEEMNQAIKLIQSLNPKPGSSVGEPAGAERLNHIYPDVAVEVNDDSQFTVSVINSIPQLQIEKSFSADSKEHAITSAGKAAQMQRQAQAFVKHKRDEAEDFIAALEKRTSTLLKVTEAIVKLQPEFFRTGLTSQIKPMILKDIEKVTGLDISTISRATASKYVATRMGTFPLKMFFNEATQSDAETSTHKVLEELKQVIENEDKRHPLSDEEIQKAMSDKGYSLARRTVAKYREKLGIPVKRLRKSY